MIKKEETLCLVLSSVSNMSRQKFGNAMETGKELKKVESNFLFLLFLLICTLLVRDRLLQCFALKAGLARHPAMGKYGAGTPGLLKLWISG